MTTSPLLNVHRCQADFNGGKCDSPIFYDWGIQVIEALSGQSIVKSAGEGLFSRYASPDHVKICTRCTTPYLIVDGALVDISSELTTEDVKLILSRGQATLPHPKIKDP